MPVITEYILTIAAEPEKLCGFFIGGIRMNEEKKLTKEELLELLLDMPDGEIHVIPLEGKMEGGDGHEV